LNRAEPVWSFTISNYKNGDVTYYTGGPSFELFFAKEGQSSQGNLIRMGKVTSELSLFQQLGISPSQAPVSAILQVDLYGTAVLLEEFGKIIADGGSGIIISSQSGHRLGALSEKENMQLAITPTEELLELPFLKDIKDTLKAYQYSKRCNGLRVMYEATRWGKRGATINSISPGVIITPLANDELNGPRGEGYRKMLSLCPAGRAGTPDEVGELAEFLMSKRGRFITGADYLIDGGTTSSYWYGAIFST
jgi:NAD(P)-dependent dehydrogenase (short-subunit alcohol dehydrogenase family)